MIFLKFPSGDLIPFEHSCFLLKTGGYEFRGATGMALYRFDTFDGTLLDWALQFWYPLQQVDNSAVRIIYLLDIFLQTFDSAPVPMRERCRDKLQALLPELAKTEALETLTRFSMAVPELERALSYCNKRLEVARKNEAEQSQQQQPE